ncbi:MAG TPA: hypothetical protein VMU09_02765, partial [Acidimicrobiales bacterium]|nr:hypothetical protein [Acidimicrobiales bacterium]
GRGAGAEREVTVAAPGPRPGLLRRGWDYVRWPPPHEGPLFSRRSQAAGYLGAWGLTVTHVVLWVLIAVGVLKGLGLTIGNSVLSFLATCLLLWVVITTHHRLQIEHGGRTRHVATAWWMGCWDPVGRLVWLPVRLPTAWHVLWRGAPASDTAGAPPAPAGGVDTGTGVTVGAEAEGPRTGGST